MKFLWTKIKGIWMIIVSEHYVLVTGSNGISAIIPKDDKEFRASVAVVELLQKAMKENKPNEKI